MKNISINIVHILEKEGLLDANQVNTLLDLPSDNSIVNYLVENRYVTEEQIIDIVGQYYGIPYVELDHTIIDIGLIDYIPYSIARHHLIVPFERIKDTLYVAMADPLNMHTIEELQTISRLDIEPFISSRQGISHTIDSIYADFNAGNIIPSYGEGATAFALDLPMGDMTSYPIIRLLDTLLAHAVIWDASDIHIEPFKDNCRIRFRIDGELHTIIELPKDIYGALISRIKILGQLDIAETRLPQDGRFMTSVDQEDIDIRISTIATMYGEKFVLRILNKSRRFLTKEKLGLTDKQLRELDILLNNPNGIILVTGPTGSGKTTTLYAILHELNTENKNIITIEDPIEYTIYGVNQIQVNNKIDFATGLRTTFRQDPDVVMVGEIRDQETASVSIRSAITGHLVLSSLHTNDAVGAIIRLIDMGVEHFLLASSLVGIISQRLIRLLCSECKKKSTLSLNERKVLRTIGFAGILKEAYFPVGCKLCNFTGYRGRTGVFEIFVITDIVREALSEDIVRQDLMQLAIESGMQPIHNQCLDLLIRGITDIDQILKIVYSNDLIYTNRG